MKDRSRATGEGARTQRARTTSNHATSDRTAAVGNRAMGRLLAAAGRVTGRGAPSDGDPGAAQVQCKDGPPRGRARSAGIETIARAGVSGAGGPLPHLRTLQRALPGHDLGRIRAYTDPGAAKAARAIGASAYAIGDRVAFSQSTPDLFTAAHETTHALQQRAGVQLKGGVGERGDRYEKNADDVAHAIVGGTKAPPILGGGGGGPAVQRISDVGRFVDNQETLMATRSTGGLAGHTTVGFEFEFATMDEGNPLSGFSHLEVAESNPMTDPHLPFVLETDASDALELVTPPFWLPTFGDQILPEPAAVGEVIDMFKSRLTDLTSGTPTIAELINEMATEDHIAFRTKNLTFARENLTHRVPKGLDVRTSTVDEARVRAIKLHPITKFGTGIDAQANIATDAHGSELLSEAFQSDRFSDDEQIKAFAYLEGRFANVLFQHAFDIREPDRRRNSAARSKTHRAMLDLDSLVYETHREATAALVRDEGFERDKAAEIKGIARDAVNAVRPGEMSIARLSRYDLTEFTAAETIKRFRAYGDVALQYVVEACGDKPPAEIISRRDRAIESIAAADAALDALTFLTDDQPMRTFLSALARALSGQIAVGAIDAVRRAQETRYVDPSHTSGFYTRHGWRDTHVETAQYLSSRVKDVRGIWAKAPILDIGLGLLSREQWSQVKTLLKKKALKRDLYAQIYDIALDGGYRLPKTQLQPLVYQVVRDIKDYVDGQHLLTKSGLGPRRAYDVSDTDRYEKSVLPATRPAFMTHDPKVMTPRQDTFVDPNVVTMSDIWGDKSRQFVVESRTGTVKTLERIKKYLHPEDNLDEIEIE